MNRILIAVDDTKGSKNAFEMSSKVCSCIRPETIVLVYVEKFEGKSLIDDMLGDAEMSTLSEVLEGTEYQEALDKKAQKILNYYRTALASRGLDNVKSVIRKGHPAEEILKTVKEEKIDMIVIGSCGNRTSHLFMGSVSREVANSADVPVIIVK
jgi:nucleotide-binding universal stress UspA family protein